MSRNHMVQVSDFSEDGIYEVSLASSAGQKGYKKLYMLVNALTREVSYQLDTRSTGLSFDSLSEAVDAYNEAVQS